MTALITEPNRRSLIVTDGRTRYGTRKIDDYRGLPAHACW